MKYKLIAEPNKNYSPMQQILVNRGIAPQDIERYIKIRKPYLSHYIDTLGKGVNK